MCRGATYRGSFHVYLPGGHERRSRFCVTTAGFWKSIGGDWKRGHHWLSRSGRPVADVGGYVLEALEEGGHDWYAMKRSNQVELHPVWFGIYDDVVYHHGAGFRDSVSRADLSKAGFPTFFHRVAGKLVDTVLDGDRIGRIRERIHPQRIVSRRISREAAGLHDEVFQAIQEDRDFFRRFIPKR